MRDKSKDKRGTVASYKETVGKLTGTIKVNGELIEGTFEVMVYVNADQEVQQGLPHGYMIGYARRIG